MQSSVYSCAIRCVSHIISLLFSNLIYSTVCYVKNKVCPIFLPLNGLPLSHCLEPHQKYGDILTCLLIILIESPLSGISQRLIRSQAGWESVLLGKV